MNIKEAKLIPLDELLERLGYTPSRQKAGELWYLSPFRQESTPSFRVDLNRNFWTDFGDGNHGDGLDLLTRHDSLGNVSAALERMQQLFRGGPPPPRPSQPAAETKRKPAIHITRSGPVQSKALKAYLTKRAIDPNLVHRYIKEVHYSVGDKSYFALGFANDNGGVELRSPYFKGCTSKDISTIGNDGSRVLVFEGFFDFLTAMSQFGGKLDGTAIVLNSVAMKEKAVAAIRELLPSVIDVYRDNDPSGQRLLDYLKQELPEPTIVDWASMYAGYNDLNEWFAAEKSPACSATR